MRAAHRFAMACAGVALLQGGAALAQSGALTQLAGTDACVSETGSDGLCGEGVALNAPVAVAVSRDGRWPDRNTGGTADDRPGNRRNQRWRCTGLRARNLCAAEHGTAPQHPHVARGGPASARRVRHAQLAVLARSADGWMRLKR